MEKEEVSMSYQEKEKPRKLQRDNPLEFNNENLDQYCKINDWRKISNQSRKTGFPKKLVNDRCNIHNKKVSRGGN